MLLKTTLKALVNDNKQPGVLPGGHTKAKGRLWGDFEPSAPGSGPQVLLHFHSNKPTMQDQ